MTPVLFRTDASAEVALGHLKRCLALAAAFEERGTPSSLLCLDDAAAHRLAPQARRTPLRINEGADAAQTADVALDIGARLVVIDSYKVDSHYIELLKRKGLAVALFEDGVMPDMPVNAVINGVIGAETLSYSAPLRLLGPRNLVMSPEYWNPAPARNGKVRRAMVTLGGIDHYDISSMFIRTMGRLLAGAGEAALDVIVGPYYENIRNIEEAVAGCPIQTVLHRSSDSLAAVIAGADVACSAGGTTLYELAVFGVPAVGIALWENQRHNVAGLGSAGALVPVFYDSGFSDAVLESVVSPLLADAPRRAAMAVRAQALVDGQGSRRVAEALANEFIAIANT